MSTETTTFVKYWEVETPVSVTTTKNEVRFYTQHGKVQVYPVIKTGRGIGKGATINFDKFEPAQLEKFTSLYNQIASTEVFLTNKSYWDNETPEVLETEANEIRFYVEHGKVQVYPKIKSGRGIGKGASINFDVPPSHRNALDLEMRKLLAQSNEVDFDELEPVDAEVEEVVVDRVEPVRKGMSEEEAFKVFKEYSLKSEDKVLELVADEIHNQELPSEFILNTFAEYPADVAIEILSSELLTHVKSYEIPFLFSMQPCDGKSLKVNIVLDREFNFDGESVVYSIIEKYQDVYVNDEEENEPESEGKETGIEYDEEDVSIYDDEHVENEEIEEDEVFNDDDLENGNEPVATIGVIATEPMVSEQSTEPVAVATEQKINRISGNLEDLQKMFKEVAFADAKDFNPTKAVEIFESLKKHVKNI